MEEHAPMPMCPMAATCDRMMNRTISGIVQALARGEEFPPESRIDPKRDVMPSEASIATRTGPWERLKSNGRHGIGVG